MTNIYLSEEQYSKVEEVNVALSELRNRINSLNSICSKPITEYWRMASPTVRRVEVMDRTHSYNIIINMSGIRSSSGRSYGSRYTECINPYIYFFKDYASRVIEAARKSKVEELGRFIDIVTKFEPLFPTPIITLIPHTRIGYIQTWRDSSYEKETITSVHLSVSNEGYVSVALDGRISCETSEKHMFYSGIIESIESANSKLESVEAYNDSVVNELSEILLPYRLDANM